MTFDTKRKFGVEVEFLSENHSQATVVQYVNSYLAEHDADFSMEYAYYSDTSNTWRIKSDSSVSGGGCWGLELVTPVLHGTRDFERLMLVLDALNNISGISVNRTCGLHVHVGVENWEVSNFKNLVKRYAKFERALDSVMPNSRRRNNGSYCESNFLHYKPLKDIYKDIDRQRTIRNLTDECGHSRYTKLNLQSFWKHGTVEFRHHSGTTNPEKISNWLKVCLAMCEAGDAKRVVKVDQDSNLQENNYTLQVFFNGLAKASDLITTDLRLFYNRRARRVA